VPEKRGGPPNSGAKGLLYEETPINEPVILGYEFLSVAGLTTLGRMRAREDRGSAKQRRRGLMHEETPVNEPVILGYEFLSVAGLTLGRLREERVSLRHRIRLISQSRPSAPPLSPLRCVCCFSL
jgi:hypothetical protein